jgi:DivIVA domain-containing protein
MGQQHPQTAPDPEVDGAVVAGWAGTRAFSTTRLRPGYDIDEVDDFLRAIRDTFLGIREPSLTPEEIRKKRFSTTRLRPGYDEEEVDAFLDEAEARLAAQVSARREALPAEPEQSAPDPAVAQRAGRSGPSRHLLIAAGGAAALVLTGGLIAGLDSSGFSTSPMPSASSFPSTGQLTVYQLRTGDCLQGSGQAIINFNEGNGPFAAIRCTQPHTAEVFFAGNAWPRSLAYPGDQAVYEDGYARCLTAFSAYDGTDSSSSAFYVVSSTPDSSTWPGGDRWLVCFAAPDALGSVNHSIRGSGQ